MLRAVGHSLWVTNRVDTMHNHLVLTIDPEQPEHEPTIVLTHSDGCTTTYIHVATFDGLIHYRNEALSEEIAQRLIA